MNLSVGSKLITLIALANSMKLRSFIALLTLMTASKALATPQNPATAQFSVTITILKQCTVNAPATISLGSVGAADLVTTVTSATQSFTVTCSLGTPYTVGFSSPNDLTSGSSIHQMKGVTSGNSNVIQYNLLDVTSGATNALPLSGLTSLISDIGTGTSQSKTLKAQITNYSVQVTPDTYNDTVTMSVTY